MELISVLMPVYNVEPYVAEAIESILAQTYENFELIIIDDCSNDNTFSICKKYAKLDSRIILIHNEHNLRIEGALNKGLSSVHGKYVVRMDGDDISDKNRLQVLHDYLLEHPEIELVGTSTTTISADGTVLGKSKFLSDWKCILNTCTIKNPIAHIWMTYKYIYDELQGYRVLFGTEDYDFILRFISSGHKCTNISDYYGYKVRINRPNNSGATFGVRQIKSHIYTVKLYRERLRKTRDSYSYNSCEKFITSTPITNKLHNISNVFLYRAIKSRSNKHYLAMCLSIIVSLISPYQWRYYFELLQYKKLSVCKGSD